MAYARIKTWIAAETLTAADLNAEFDGNITNENALLTALNAEIATRATLEDEHDALKAAYDARFDILGDTAGYVLRMIRIQIEDATDDDHIKVTGLAVWNSSAIAVEDNIDDGETGTRFAAGAASEYVDVLAASLDGNAVAVLGAWLSSNASGSDLQIHCTAVSNKLRVTPRDATSGASIDLATLVDTGTMIVDISYLTDG